MKVEFPHKPGDVVTIYADWENEKSPIGTAKLVSFHRQGRTFILEDMYPEDTQIVYNWQEWKVELLKTVSGSIVGNQKRKLYLIRKIRYVDTIGISNSADDDEYVKEEIDKLIKDSFLEFNGIQIY